MNATLRDVSLLDDITSVKSDVKYMYGIILLLTFDKKILFQSNVLRSNYN